MKLKKFKKLVERFAHAGANIVTQNTNNILYDRSRQTFNFDDAYLSGFASELKISDLFKPKEKKAKQESKDCWIHFNNVLKFDLRTNDFDNIGYFQLDGTEHFINFKDGYSLSKHKIANTKEGTAIYLKDYIIWIETNMETIHDLLHNFIIDAKHHKWNSYFNYNLYPVVVFKNVAI